MGKDIDAEVWESLGSQDPDWAVESRPTKQHGGWEEDLDEFYATGRSRVEQALEFAKPTGNERALDWGSGTGRLSFTLAEKFGSVTAVDVSTSMQRLLIQRAQERRIDNVKPVLVDDFKPAGDRDFALSLITMQHFHDRQTVESALQAMIASLKPTGVMVFEIPVGAHTLRYRIAPRLQAYRVLRRLGMSPEALYARGFSGIKMLCLPRGWVRSTLAANGAELLNVREYRGTSHQFAWYLAKRS